MTRKPLPMQPLEWDHDVLRFRRNLVVERLLDEASKRGYDLNNLICAGLPDEDWAQFAQLIGYSQSGWSSLSYVSPRDVARSERMTVPPKD